MPKRTNDFQRLVTIIEGQLASHDAVVTPSKELWHPRSGSYREVDIVIETKAGAHPVIIGVECIDWRRRAGQQWVERVFQLHRELGIDKTVLVTRAGYWETALRLAKSHSMIPLTVDEVDGFPWLQAAGFSLARNAIVQILIDVPDCDENQPLDPHKTLLFGPDGKSSASVWDVVTESLMLPDALLQTSQLTANEPNRVITFEIGIPHGTFILDKRGSPQTVQRLAVRFVHMVQAFATFQHHRYGDLADVAHAILPKDEGSIELTLTRVPS